jgi:hypothetical protein
MKRGPTLKAPLLESSVEETETLISHTNERLNTNLDGLSRHARSLVVYVYCIVHACLLRSPSTPSPYDGKYLPSSTDVRLWTDLIQITPSITPRPL